MIRITGPHGPSGPQQTRAPQGPRGPGGDFRVGEGGGAQGASAAAPAASSSALGALIALQSETGGRRRNFAAAERTLMLLERLRDGLLSGRIPVSDLEGLANAAGAKLDDPDPEIAALYADISLRARVELAKLGR
ncbi:MAG: flagellar assembly protein FliX [Parvularculaceae bacterium]|nr:flagellar assembly protein FliX [Parvularculaceae bacterium]